MGLIWLTVKSATRLPLTSWPWVGHAIAGGGRRGAAGKAIVTLVLIADDNVCRSEVDTLKRLDAPRELGLNLDRLPGIVQSLCEDFLMGAHFRGCMIAGVDDSALVSLMAEVDEPELQRKVLRLAVAAALANRRQADGEALVLAGARRQWGLYQEGKRRRPVRCRPGLCVSSSAQVRTAAMICSTSG